MDNIDRYIQTEIDMSKYRIQMLGDRKSLSLAKKCILKKELEFLRIPFSSIRFQSAKEASDAIRLFKSSRSQFYKKYECINIKEIKGLFQTQLSHLIMKKDEFLKSRVEEINLIQNPYFYNELVKSEVQKGILTDNEVRSSYSKMSLDEINKLEPARLGKMRARVQAIVYSIGLYLSESLRDFLHPDDSIDSIYDSMDQLADIIKNIRGVFFKYYNSALKTLPLKLKNTMGKNVHFSKLHKLRNLMDDYPGSGKPIYRGSNFNENVPQVGHVLYGIKKAIYQTLLKDKGRDRSNSAYGILLPIERVGHEKLSLLFKNISCDDVNITDLFSDSLSNIKASDHNGEVIYFKSLMLKPLWKFFGGKRLASDQFYKLTQIIGVSEEEILDNLNDNDLATKINTTCTNFLNLSRDYSIILVAKTRSEEDCLQEALEIASGRIEDLYSLFATND